MDNFWSMLFFQLSLQKQTLEKDLDTLKEKQKWMEGQVQESQKKEAQTQAKLMVTHKHILYEQMDLGIYYSLADSCW